jgi:endoglucanase
MYPTMSFGSILRLVLPLTLISSLLAACWDDAPSSALSAVTPGPQALADSAPSAPVAFVIPPPGTFSVHISGAHLVDGNGNVVQLRGVNVSGLEGVAIIGWNPKDPWGGIGKPLPDWKAMKTWGVNAVRLPLNEASWRGGNCTDEGGFSFTYVNGVQTQDKPGQVIQTDPGNNYQATVIASVNSATAAGLYVILDLHLSAPGGACPTTQNAMADADHSVTFWTSLANAFKGYPSVVFELFNEPFLDQTSLQDHAPWPDLLNGTGTLSSYIVQGKPSIITYTWHNAGMQQMLNAVRAAGATNVVLTSTLAYSSQMDGWLHYHPTDSLKPSQVGAVWHAYPAPNYPTQESCIGLPSCSSQIMTEVQRILAAGFPVVLTEFGDAIGGNAPFASVLLPFADANGVGYLGWTWDAWKAPANVLITDMSGTPTVGYGAYVKAHYLCRAAGSVKCP